MVAIAIFMLVIGAIFTTWALVTRASTVGQTAAANAQRERVALRTIEDAIMCVQSFQASQKFYYFNVENGEAARLSFAAHVPDGFPRNGKFGDYNLRRLTFSLEPGSDGMKNLVLRQNPILMPLEEDEDEMKYPLVLARNVKAFVVECWDTNKFEWASEWLDTNSIPTFIRVGIALQAKPAPGQFGTMPATVVTRAFAVPSAMMPPPLQHGNVPGGPPGAPPVNALPIARPGASAQ